MLELGVGECGDHVSHLRKFHLKPKTSDGAEISDAVRQLQEKPLGLGSRKPQVTSAETIFPGLHENVGTPLGLLGENEREKSVGLIGGSKFGQPFQLHLIQQRDLLVAWARDHAQSDALASNERSQVGQQFLRFTARQIVREDGRFIANLVLRFFPLPDPFSSRVHHQHSLVAGDFNPKTDLLAGIALPRAQQHAGECFRGAPFYVEVHCALRI